MTGLIFLFSTSDWISLITAIAALITAIVALITINEVRKQRQHSYQPDLDIANIDFYVYRYDKDEEDDKKGCNKRLAQKGPGFILFLLGTRPDFFGADRSPVIGFVQIATFTIGLAFICVGGYSSLAGLWGKRELSLLADIGPRLVATGFVICVFSGMADVFGFGSHLLPDTVPYFGQWQAAGVQAGEFFIALGFLLLIPFHRFRHK